MNREGQEATPIRKPPGWDSRSGAQRLFENVPLVGTRWLLNRAIKTELRSRTEDVLKLWEPFAKDGFDCVEMVLKPIRQAGWPNHFFIPADDFPLLAPPPEMLDVLNEICLRCGVGARGRNRLTDGLLYSDLAARFADFPEDSYSGTIGTLATHILGLRTAPR